MRRRLGLIVVAVWSVWSGLVAPAIAGESDAAAGASFATANQAYQHERYDEATAGYQALIDAGVVHADLFYNLGNAHFRAGQLGHAAYCYERALRVDPELDDARANLEVTRAAVAAVAVDRLEDAEEPTLGLRVLQVLSPAQLTWAFAVFNLLLFAGLAVHRLLPRRSIRAATIAMAVGFAATAALLAARAIDDDSVHAGVILPIRAELHEGPADTTARRVVVHAGLRVRVMGGQGRWRKIRLQNGAEGWLRADAVGELP